MNFNLPNSMPLQELFNVWLRQSTEEGSLAVIAYESVYNAGDEDIDYIDAVGIDTDKNIYLAKDYKDLTSLEQNGVYIKKCISRITDFREMMMDIIHLIGRYSDPRGTIFVKTYTGHILPVKEIIEDIEYQSIVFLT